MSDHYCCKQCGLRYDECKCPPKESAQSTFDAVGLIRKAQVDTVLDAIQMIVKLSSMPQVNHEDHRNAEHMVMRLQTMLRTI